MADMGDHYGKARKSSGKLTWSTWSIPDHMSESEVQIRRERKAKRQKKLKHHDVDQLNRIPFEEMFLFGSHPESDILSISKCPGCSRRYKTQWLHNYHWELIPSGEYVCALTKAVVIPHRSSSKSEHHGHHHRDSSKGIESNHHGHSKQNNIVNQTKVHHSGSSANPGKVPVPVLAKVEDQTKNQLKPAKGAKPPLMTKAKVKMLPPLPSPPLSSSSSKSSASATKVQPRSSSGSYTLSIPSDDTGQNESVESLLQSNKLFATGSALGSKSIQMIATAIKSSSSKTVPAEPEYEQMKFYGDTTTVPEKKIKSTGTAQGHNHSHHSYNHSSKTGSGDLERNENVISPSDSKASLKSKSSHGNQGPSLQSFKIPLKSKSSGTVLSPQTSPHPQNHQITPNTTNVKTKPKIAASSKSSHMEVSPASYRSPTGSLSPAPSPGGSHRSIHNSGSSQSNHVNMPYSSPSSIGVPPPSVPLQANIIENSPPFKSPAIQLIPDPLLQKEVKTEEFVSPPKKKKKKKSKNEPRKVLPLKDRLFDPDQHCGVVSNPDTGVPCTRSLTCKTHSMAMRRAVPGRSQGFDQLLADHKKARDAEKAAKIAEEQQQLLQNCVATAVATQIIPAMSAVANLAKSAPVKGKSKPLQSSNDISQLNDSGFGNGGISQRSPAPATVSSHYGMDSLSSGLKHGSHPQLDLSTNSREVNALDMDTSASMNRSNSMQSSYTLSLSQMDTSGFPSNESKTLIYESEDLAAMSGMGAYKVTSSGKADSKGMLGDSFASVTDFGNDCSKLEMPQALVGDYSSSKRNDYRLNHLYQQKLGLPKLGESSNMGESFNMEPMEIQDPISTAIEMASASAVEESSHYRHDSSSSVNRRMISSMNHAVEQAYGSSQNPLMFQPSALHSITSPASSYTVESPSVHTPNSSMNFATPGSGYQVPSTSAMSSSAFSAVPLSGHLDYATFGTEALSDYHNESYAAAHMYSMAPSSSLAPAYSPYSAAAPIYSPAPHQSINYHTGNVYPKIPNLFTPPGVYPNSYAPSTVHPPADVNSSLYAVNTPSLFPTEPPVFSIIDDLFPETAVINDTGGFPPSEMDFSSINSNQSFQRPFHTTTRTPGMPVPGPGPPGNVIHPNSQNTEPVPALTLNSDGAKLNGPNSGNGLPGIRADKSAEGPQTSQSSFLGKRHSGSIKKLLAMHEKLNQYEQRTGSVESIMSSMKSVAFVHISQSTSINQNKSVNETSEAGKPGLLSTELSKKCKIIKKSKKISGVRYGLLEPQITSTDVEVQGALFSQPDSDIPEIDDFQEPQNLESQSKNGEASEGVDLDVHREMETCMISLPPPLDDGSSDGVDQSSCSSYIKAPPKKKCRIDKVISYENKFNSLNLKEAYDDVRKLRVKDVLRVLNFANATHWDISGKSCGAVAEASTISREIFDHSSMANDMETYIDGIQFVEVKQ